VYEVVVIPVWYAVVPSPPAVVLRYRLYDVAPLLAVHDSESCVSPTVAVKPVGVDGAWANAADAPRAMSNTARLTYR
jgi:hypothetical protein